MLNRTLAGFMVLISACFISTFLFHPKRIVNIDRSKREQKRRCSSAPNTSKTSSSQLERNSSLRADNLRRNFGRIFIEAAQLRKSSTFKWKNRTNAKIMRHKRVPVSKLESRVGFRHFRQSIKPTSSLPAISVSYTHLTLPTILLV